MTNSVLSTEQLRQFVELLPQRKIRETEVVELKEARNDFSFKDLTRYFSALSNEAGLREAPVALLIFGVCDDGTVCGTSYRVDAPMKLQNLKREIAGKTNQHLTFREITELRVHGQRVLVFQIPPALRGMPTTWENVAWGRNGSDLVPLSLDKIDAIRAQPRDEWARKPIPQATFDDLDPLAIEHATEAFRQRYYSNRPALLTGLQAEDLIEKIGLMRAGMLTNAAVMLLGKEGTEALFDGPAPLVTWTLYSDTGQSLSYQHYGTPLLLGLEHAAQKIRNEPVPILDPSSRLAVSMIRQYDYWSIRELLGNALAHQDYGMSRRIYLNEFPGRLEIVNEGTFIPESVRRVLENGYHAPLYRNPFLCDSLTKLGLLDQNTLGIRRVYTVQRNRRMPMPTYDLSDPARVSVTLWGHEIDAQFTAALADESLSLQDVYALDLVQKRLPVTDAEAESLLARQLLIRQGNGYEIAVHRHVQDVPPTGQTPNTTASIGHEDGDGWRTYGGSKPRLVRTSERRRLAVMHALDGGPKRRGDILEWLDRQGLSELFGKDPTRTLSSVLRAMAKEGTVISDGHTKGAVWRLRDDAETCASS